MKFNLHGIVFVTGIGQCSSVLCRRPFGRGSGKFASIKIPVTLQFREVLMTIILALALQFHTLNLSCSMPSLKVTSDSNPMIERTVNSYV